MRPIGILSLLVAAPGAAQTPLTTTLVSAGFDRPTEVTAPFGDTRLFVAELGGVIHVVKDGALLPTPFLDLSGQILAGGERGLLGLAFHPDHAANGQLFVHYSDLVGDTVVARFTTSANPDVGDPASELTILTLSQPFANHNGGALRFGPAGNLWLALGDGGGGADPSCNGQDLGTWFGKLLRLDVDAAFPYALPADNPFLGVAGAAPEVAHYGLRNPWRFSFDRVTGDLWIGDVGAAAREEVDVVPGGTLGANFGWKAQEGTQCASTFGCPPGTPVCGDAAFIDPIVELAHSGFLGPTSVIGGCVYRGCAIPDLAGEYFFTDFGDGLIRSLRWDPLLGLTSFVDRTTELDPPGALDVRRISSIGEGGLGELYFLDYSDGELFRLDPAAPPAGLVDCDGNGRDDGCELASGLALDLDSNGVPDVCQELSADRDALSLAAGGVQALALHAGASHAGELHLLLGSLSGTLPGTPFGGLVVPLNVDAYALFTLGNPGAAPLGGSLGVLDASGEAGATFSAAAGAFPASLVGASAQHAYLSFSGAGVATLASNPVSLRFDP